MGSGMPAGDEVPPVSCSHPVHETIRGKHVELIPMQVENTEELFAVVGGDANATLYDYMPYGPFADVQALQGKVSGFADSKDPLFWTIRLLSTGQMVGWMTFLRIDSANRVVEIGNILYAPQLQRTTAATEAWYLLANKAFLEGYRRLEWKCNSNNAPSRRAAIRLGHSFEGIFRKHMIVKGRNRDTAWFAITDDEWPNRQAALVKWMDPSNFDSEGKQINDLASLRAT